MMNFVHALQVKRLSDNSTADVPVMSAGGFANAAVQVPSLREEKVE